MNFTQIEPLEARIAPATISIAPTSVSEGNSGTTPATFTITLSEAATEQITVHFATSDGTAVSTGNFADYQAQADTTITFEIGDTTKDVPVDVIGDPYAEANETFNATLSNPSGSNTISTATATGTINNDDSAATFSISAAADVTEGVGVTSKFTLTLSHAVETDAAVTYTTGIASDTAKPAPGLFTDYIAKTGTVTFTAGGALTQEISIAITDDTFKEDTEQFTVTLSSPTGASLSGASSALGKILNDAADTTVGLHLDDVKHVEGNADNTVTLKPTLSGTLATDLDLTLTTQSGTAVGGSDYTSVSLSPVKIVAGQLFKTFDITVKGDTKFEATENFFVNLSGATGVTVVNDHEIGSGAQATARVYLYNDDVQNLGPLKAQWIDVDGDLVTMTVTKGSLPLDNSTLFTFDTTTSTVGGRILQKLDLNSFRTIFAGTSVTITATKQVGFPDASDGRVDVGLIQAATFVSSELQVIGMDLGTVTVDGDLAQISAGDQYSTPAIAKLDVYSLGVKTSTLPPPDPNANATILRTQSDILGPIGTVNVKTDLAGFLHVVGAEFGTLGTLKIGGALKGGALDNTGRVSVSGRLGTATIGSIVGGTGAATGFLSGTDVTNGSLGNITVLGNITGGTGASSGQIEGYRVGNVTAGSVIGGTGTQSGLVLARLSLGNVTLSGDLLGGTTASAGEIFSGTTIGAIKIAGKITGGTGDDSGSIQSGGNITSLSVATIAGGTGQGSGSVRVGVSNTGTANSVAGKIGTINITGKDANDDSLKGGSGINSGRIDILGSIASFTAAGDVQGSTGKGSGELISRSTIGAIKIAGSLTGDVGEDSGSIQSQGNITSLSIGKTGVAGGIFGGIGKGSGSVRAGVDNSGTATAAANLGAVNILAKDANGDSLKGGTGVNSGRLDVAGNILSFTSPGNVHGNSANGTGGIVATGNIDKIVISGSLLGGASTGSAFLNKSGFISALRLKSVSIAHDIISGVNGGAGIASSGSIRADVIDTLTIGGNVTGNSTGNNLSAVTISAKGLGSTLAIKTLTITGAAKFAEILAGYNDVATATVPRGTGVSGDASLGAIVIGGDVLGLNIVAGATVGPDGRFGGTDDGAISASSSSVNNPLNFSKIASIVIKGAVLANPAGAAAGYGVVAQNVGSIKIGSAGTLVALHAGAGNDLTPLEIGTTTNFHVVELPVT